MILVTGGTGLVGSHLLYKLVSQNETVKAIYRTEDKFDIVKRVFSYYTSNSDYLFSKIIWMKADLLDIPELTLAFKNVTKVYHCAAFVSFEPDKYTLLRRTNIEGTANIVNLALANNIEKLCYVSSIATLGESLNNTLITETTYWNPEADNNIYAITKYGAEMEVWRGTQEGLNAVIVNPGVILGGGIWNHGSGTFFTQVQKKLSYYTNGVTGFVDVDDVTEIMIKLMESDISKESFILVSENISYKALLSTIAEQLNVKPPHKEVSTLMANLGWRLDWLNHKLTGKRRRLSKQLASTINNTSYYSNTKISELLDFKWTTVEKSIAKTAEQFKKDNL
ncbi:NAD-dependent epimerase/dehydratase family protein [Formosa sp. S-31]|uniref:NAD-dependent epimerase/dehydratase family protein n=1 Tax=Formosa sp. S-31 TaxID=2790949 RepID=UPI003EBB40CD